MSGCYRKAYAGDAENNPAGRAEEVPPDLWQDACAAGLMRYTSGDTDFDIERVGDQGWTT